MFPEKGLGLSNDLIPVWNRRQTDDLTSRSYPWCSFCSDLCYRSLIHILVLQGKKLQCPPELHYITFLDVLISLLWG